jgi:predicted nucleic acid-binding protein
LKIDEDVFEYSWETFKNQKISKFSFTDCSNVSLMRDKGIRYIATFDREFRKINSIKVVG